MAFQGKDCDVTPCLFALADRPCLRAESEDSGQRTEEAHLLTRFSCRFAASRLHLETVDNSHPVHHFPRLPIPPSQHLFTSTAIVRRRFSDLDTSALRFSSSFVAAIAESDTTMSQEKQPTPTPTPYALPNLIVLTQAFPLQREG